jgi:hypothetical protein
MVKKGHPESCQMEETNSSSEKHEDRGYVRYIYFVRIGPYCTVDFLAKGSRFRDLDF